jgi:hypothetical protein
MLVGDKLYRRWFVWNSEGGGTATVWICTWQVASWRMEFVTFVTDWGFVSSGYLGELLTGFVSSGYLGELLTGFLSLGCLGELLSGFVSSGYLG